MTDTCIHQLKSSFPLLSHFPTSENMSYITLFWITGVFTAAFDSGIEWLIVKGIADYAVSCSAQQNAKSWRRCACVMAASLVMHILSNPTVFRCWPHYKGNFDKTLILFCWFVSILLRFLKYLNFKNAVKAISILCHRRNLILRMRHKFPLFNDNYFFDHFWHS